MKRGRGLFSLRLFLGLLGNCLRLLLLTVSRLTCNTYQILIIVLDTVPNFLTVDDIPASKRRRLS